MMCVCVCVFPLWDVSACRTSVFSLPHLKLCHSLHSLYLNNAPPPPLVFHWTKRGLKLLLPVLSFQWQTEASTVDGGLAQCRSI